MLKLSDLLYSVEIPLQTTVYQMPPFETRKNYKNSPDGSWPDYELITTIERTRDISQGIDLYFIRLVRIKGGNKKNQVVGYLYFSYDEIEKKSAFYGVKVRSSFRNRGISKFLIARWIETTINNDVEKLYTISRQRKPIFIYSLKQLSFELEDPSLYYQGHDIIICKDSTNDKKVLFFENAEEGEAFAKGTINKETPHIIIQSLSDKYEELARVLLENPYFAKNIEIAYQDSMETIETFPAKIRGR